MKREEDFDMADQAYQEGRAEADTEVHQLRELLVKADAEIRRLRDALHRAMELHSIPDTEWTADSEEAYDKLVSDYEALNSEEVSSE